MPARSRIVLVLALALGVWLSSAAQGQAATRYRLVDLGLNFDFYTAGTPINNHAQVTGNITVRENESYQPRTFLWQHGTQTLLDCDGCNPSAINDDGVIVGLFYKFTGFMFHDGVFTKIPSLPGANDQTDPWAVNNSGEIWGTGYFDQPSFHAELWRYRHGRLRNLGTVAPGASDVSGRIFSPRRGVVGGSVGYPDGSGSGFVWDHGELRLLYGPQGSSQDSPVDMNRDLVAVGVSVDAKGRRSAIRYTATGARYLARLGTTRDSYAAAINDHGLIVGTDSGEAVIWKHGRVINLNRITRMGAGWHLEYCIDVNSHGAITAQAMDFPEGEHLVLLKPVRTG